MVLRFLTMTCFKIMNVGGFLFYFICLWSCGCHLLAPRYMSALGGQIPAQTVSSEGAPISTDTSTGWYLSLPSSSSHHGPQGKPWLLWIPASSWEENKDHHENISWVKRQGRGQDPTLLADPSPLETKLNCILHKLKQQKQVSMSQAAAGCAHWCNAHAEQPLQQCLAFWQPKPGQDPRAASAWAKMLHFPWTPPFPWSHNKAKQKTPCREGWMDGLMIWVVLCFCI